MTPPIFRPLSYEQARDAAAAEKKWLLVDFSAEWCQPCKHMDRTTWVAPEVVEWVNANAVAIQLDGDHSAVAQEFYVQAYPTVIAFDGEFELDRISGARPAAALLSWLADLKGGRTELDRLRAAPREDLSGQLQLARALADRRRDDEALEVFAWLWEHSLEVSRSWVGVRSSFLIGALEPLIERSPPARLRFEQFRDAAGMRPDHRGRQDFVVLNRLLGEEDRTLEWLRKQTPEDAQALIIDHRIHELVERRKELTLFANLIGDPLALLEDQQEGVEQLRAFGEKLPAGTVQRLEKSREELANLMARALRAAGRNGEADRVEARARELKN